MSIKIYRDQAANSIFIEDSNGAQFINSLQASVPDTTVTITDLARQIEIVSNADHTDFVDENDNAYPGTATDVCNQLNAIFSSSGTPTTEPPVITSPLTINSVQGSVVNYELTADFGVGYEWDFSNVPGIVNVEGNVRKIIGGSSLPVGTYNIPVKAINYNDADSQTIVLTVSTPPFANTKSVRLNQNKWLGANAALLTALERSGNGSGSGDAWTISFYFKAGSSNNQEQTIFYFGSNDIANGNHIRIYWNGNNTARQQLVFRYGTNNNNLLFKTPVGSLSNDGSWHHCIITYNGGTTGSSSGNLSNYYSRFKIYIDGSLQTTINAHSNFGITTGLTGQNARIGRYNSAGYMRNNCGLDELAVWSSDQTSNVSSIYNGGTPHDLGLLTDSPDHWTRFEDAYPNMLDSGDLGNLIYVMNGMTSADLVNDVP